MPRDALAYLLDITEACEAIASAINGLDLDAYRGNRLVRSSVEREFIIIGEAIGSLARYAPEIFVQITQARRIVDFRNQLTHQYATITDTIVWAIANREAPILHQECHVLLTVLEQGSSGDQPSLE